MPATRPEPVAPLVEHFFRHEAGRLVSVLTRIFGWRHFNLVEDMVQATLMDALQAWRSGQPFRVGAPHCQEQDRRCLAA